MPAGVLKNRMTFSRASTWQRGLGTGILSVALATSGVVTTWVPTAHAQSVQELAKARAEYKEGLSLEAAGNWAGALSKFQDVARIKTTPQVRFHVARCKENLGRLNEALGEYRLAEYEAQQAKPQPKELPEITKAREQLEARVPKVVIERGEGAKSAKIEIDGVALGEAQVGKEFAVDPGPHKITAKVDRGEWEQNIEVAEGETKSVELVAPADLKKPDSSGTSDPDDVEKPPDDTGPVQDEKKGPGALPWIVGGIGVVGLAAGGYFFLQRNKAEDDLKGVCRNDVCPASKQSLQDDGKRYALLTNISLGVGIVGIGTAIVLFATSGKKAEKKPGTAARSLHLIPTASSRNTGVNLVGSF